MTSQIEVCEISISLIYQHSLTDCNRMLGGLISGGCQRDLGLDFFHMWCVLSLLHFSLHIFIFEALSSVETGIGTCIYSRNHA